MISGSSRSASSRVQPVLASTRIGPLNTSRTARERLEVLRPAALDLERREIGGAGGTLGDDRRLVDADREIGRRDLGRQADQLVDRDAEDLAGEVVEGDVERALGGAVPADVGCPCRADASELLAQPPRDRPDRCECPRQARQEHGQIAAIVSGVSP